MNAFDRMRATARSRRLVKDPANGIIFGVCAGIAWWLGVKSWAVRLLAVIALIVWTGPVILAYAAAALILSKRPRDSYESADERFAFRSGRRWDRFERGL